MPLAAASQSTLEPASDAARTIADLWWVLFVISVVVVAVVLVLVLAAALRGRAGRGTAAPVPDAPESRGARLLIAVGGAAVPAVVLVVLFALTVAALPATSPPEEGEAELVVEVEGRQWFWEVRYPERDVVTANEIHIPARVPVEVRATTADVIHSFWVPRLNRKIDMIPGRVNSLLLEADRPGTYRGQCAEFCGLQHANMAFLVIAHEPAEFERWLQREARPAAEADGEGLDVFLDSGCGGCHTIRGTGADGELGPDLTHVASRSTIAAATLPNTKGHLGGWILDPQALKPGNRMPATPLEGDELQALLEYLGGLE